ncbi:Bicarbonate transport system permease protein CmpB [Gracilariopsis chorda]|uniref:Bicarbonate transport system permease protein CmpB n=1 Tax=Gracilariopsis chorda TaxID=448386 RepID=A0A2V3J6T5_9FLOR|nr:Bicarbonate transport system permease protein CmpB [Gracilariopsis chorda]|eukprot:PXF50084.1 Bicarbonate transport system permease protein CmpB [Gracilariopsis chorda]
MPAFVNYATLKRSAFTPSHISVCRTTTANGRLSRLIYRRSRLRHAVSMSDKGERQSRGRSDTEQATDDQIRDEEPEDTFVLEDAYLVEDDMLNDSDDDDRRIIWNKLPSPRALFKTSYITDLVIVFAIVAIVYGLVQTTGRLFSSAPYSALTIETSLNVLPWYAAQSLTRMAAGYVVSLIFSLIYAYIAYRVKFAARLLMLVIDVLQSIPLLSFLPGVVLGLIAIFPGARVGVELAAVLLLFTSMAWNMLLGFYQSLSCIPHDLQDVSNTFRLSPWKRFWVLELPAGAIGLVWNSIISVAGGWFFLISIESFELGNRDFKLPGIGSYLAVAAETSNYTAIFAGLLTIVAIIVVIDFVLWRPLITWSTKFTYGSTPDENKPRSVVLNALQKSPLFRRLHSSVVAPAWEDFVNLNIRNPITGELIATDEAKKAKWARDTIATKEIPYVEENGGGFEIPLWRFFTQVFSSASEVVSGVAGRALPVLVFTALSVGIGYGVFQAGQLVNALPLESWISIGTAAAATFGRVLAALGLSLLWTVPAGVAIGRNAKLSATVQPIVQIAASVPATALFPFLLLFLARLGGGLEIGSVALMMLGTMWYVLFNVIAGAQAIPSELFDVDSVYNKEGVVKRWRKLILPGIFPYLITGIVTAVGGAWNASIVSEYVVFQGGVLKTDGLGALISEAAAGGDYALLLAGTVVMSLLVLVTNKFVWGPLYRLAETKYRM